MEEIIAPVSKELLKAEPRIRGCVIRTKATMRYTW